MIRYIKPGICYVNDEGALTFENFTLNGYKSLYEKQTQRAMLDAYLEQEDFDSLHIQNLEDAFKKGWEEIENQ